MVKKVDNGKREKGGGGEREEGVRRGEREGVGVWERLFEDTGRGLEARERFFGGAEEAI